MVKREGAGDGEKRRTRRFCKEKTRRWLKEKDRRWLKEKDQENDEKRSRRW